MYSHGIYIIKLEKFHNQFSQKFISDHKDRNKGTRKFSELQISQFNNTSNKIIRDYLILKKKIPHITARFTSKFKPLMDRLVAMFVNKWQNSLQNLILIR